MMSLFKKIGKFLLEYSYKTIEIIMSFFMGLIIAAPITGVLFTYFNLYWGLVAFLCSLILGSILGFLFFHNKLFYTDNNREKIILLIVFIICIIVYKEYSPVLRLKQDPALYMFRSMNLLNYGYVYKPMLTYNHLFVNGIVSDMTVKTSSMIGGTGLRGYKLYPDFFPGGSYFYSLFGFVNKQFIFYGQSVIMIVNGWLLYFVIKRITKIKNCVIMGFYTLAFFISPLIVWFGRGSFTEPLALFFLLAIINMLIIKKNPWLIVICFLLSYTARIDYFVVLLLGVFIITYINIKIGFVYSVLAIIEFLVFCKTNSIYYNRIVELEIPILGYTVFLIIVIFFISFLIIKFAKEFIEKIFYSKFTKSFLIFIGVVCALLMFYNNIIDPANYNIEYIHNQFLRTYAEEILDLLFLVFPSIIIVGGLLGLHTFINKEKLPFVVSAFLVTFGIGYLYLLVGGNNSPMLYWFLRRYYNNVIPITFIAFCMLFSEIKTKQGIILSFACFLLSLNLFVDSEQIVDFKGLDKSVIEVEKQIKDAGYQTVYYDKDLTDDVSPLISYSDLEFVPLKHDELSILIENRDKFKIENAIFFTQCYTQIECDVVYELSYQKQGESYGEIPKTTYDKIDVLKGYNFKELLETANSWEIYPYGFVEQVIGLDEAGWMEGTLELVLKPMNIEYVDDMVINLNKDVINPLIINDEINNLNLKVILNDDMIIVPTSYNDGKIKLSLDNYKQDIVNIKITSNTFNPSKYKINSDTRELGIAIESIFLQ